MLDTDFERQIYSNHHAAQSVDEGETLFTTFADRVVRHCNRLLDIWLREGTPYAKHARLLHILLPRLGVSNAISAGVVCERMRISPRDLKQLVHELRLDHRVQIGASRDGEAGGYYLISNEQESIESSEQMLHQAINMLRVVRVLRSKQTAAELAGQVRLALESSTEGEGL